MRFSVCEVETDIFMYLGLKVMSFFQENAVDLHSLGRIPQHPRQRSGGSHIDSVKGMSLLLGVLPVTRPKSNVCTALTTQKNKENIGNISHAQNTIVF